MGDFFYNSSSPPRGLAGRRQKERPQTQLKCRLRRQQNVKVEEEFFKGEGEMKRVRESFCFADGQGQSFFPSLVKCIETITINGKFAPSDSGKSRLHLQGCIMHILNSQTVSFLCLRLKLPLSGRNKKVFSECIFPPPDLGRKCGVNNERLCQLYFQSAVSNGEKNF